MKSFARSTAAVLLATVLCCPVSAPFAAPSHILDILDRYGVSSNRVFSTPLPGAPFVTGLRNASVFLPTDFLERFSAEEQRWIVIHELTHIRRGDLWLRFAAEVFRALFWFNPLVHVAVHALRQDQEYVCDQAVVSRCTRQGDTNTGGPSCWARAHSECLRS